MDELDLLLEFDARDLEIFERVSQMILEKDAVLEKIEADTPKLKQMAETEPAKYNSALEKYLEDLLS